MYKLWIFREAVQEAVRNAEQEATRKAEKMLIIAIHNGAAQPVIEAMRLDAGITDSRLDELKKQANMA